MTSAGTSAEAAEWRTLVRARLGDTEALPEVRRLLRESGAPEVRMEAAWGLLTSGLEVTPTGDGKYEVVGP